MNEQQFLLELERRAQEQEALMNRLVTPRAVFLLSLWLGRHPWRFMIPFSFLLTILFRGIFGYSYSEFILWIFGGL